MEAHRPDSIARGLDPRARIYRDPFNEIFVLVLSASAASVVIPVVSLIVMAFAGKMDLWPYVAMSTVVELLLIFGVARPQMKPWERVAWGLLWGFAAAFFAFCFWYLVIDPLVA